MTTPKIKRLKKYDTKAGHKVLLHLYIKDSCFHCDVKQAIKSGEDITYNREEQKSFISEFAPEYENMIRLDRVNLDGRTIDDVANSIYFAKETLKHFADVTLNGAPYTQEDHNEELKILWGGVVNHKIFTASNIKWPLLCDSLKKYQDKQGDLYKYKDFTKSVCHWVAQSEKAIGVMATKYTKPLIIDYFDKLSKYRELEAKYKYKTLPVKRDLWTIDRLANHLNISIDQAKTLILSSDLGGDVEKIVLENAENMKKELDSIVKQYKLLPNS